MATTRWQTETSELRAGAPAPTYSAAPVPEPQVRCIPQLPGPDDAERNRKRAEAVLRERDARFRGRRPQRLW
jgi:hypothetical protein